MNFNVDFDFAETLKQAEADKVKATLHLRRGASLSGTVSAVGSHVAVLARLTGKDRYDALVSIDDITAIEIQTRTS